MYNVVDGHLVMALAAAPGSCLERLPAVLLHLLQLMRVLVPERIHSRGMLPLQLLKSACMFSPYMLQTVCVLLRLLPGCPVRSTIEIDISLTSALILTIYKRPTH